jgi:hypothetical protein
LAKEVEDGAAEGASEDRRNEESVMGEKKREEKGWIHHIAYGFIPAIVLAGSYLMAMMDVLRGPSRTAQAVELVQPIASAKSIVLWCALAWFVASWVMATLILFWQEKYQREADWHTREHDEDQAKIGFHRRAFERSFDLLLSLAIRLWNAKITNQQAQEEERQLAQEFNAFCRSARQDIVHHFLQLHEEGYFSLEKLLHHGRGEVPTGVLEDVIRKRLEDHPLDYDDLKPYQKEWLKFLQGIVAKAKKRVSPVSCPVPPGQP